MNAVKKTIALKAVKAFRDATGINAEYQLDMVDGYNFPDGIIRIL
jgi:hypothetical protein